MDNFNSRITEANNDINAVNNKTQQNTAEISQLREQIGDLGGFYAGNSAPSKTNLLWIDTGNNNLLKYIMVAHGYLLVLLGAKGGV